MNEILNSAADTVLRYLLIGSSTALILVLLAWAIIKTARLRTPVYRHMIWLYALVGVVVLPLIWLCGPKLTLAVLPRRVASTEAVTLAPISLGDVVTRAQGPLYPEPSHAEIAPAVKARRQALPLKTALAGAWFVGFVFMVARLGVGWYRLRRFYLSATPVPASECPANLSRRRLRVLLTSQLQGPVCFGVFRPVILLPQDTYQNGTTENLQMVLTHELAHIERRDCWINLFQRIVEAVFFFHPLVWLASRQLTHEREQICDNHVLAQGASVDEYTGLLSDIGERAVRRTYIQTVALFEGQLLSRIRSLLDPLRSRQTRLPWRAAIACTLAVLVAFVAFGSVRLAAKPSMDAGGVDAPPASPARAETKAPAEDAAQLAELLQQAVAVGDIEQVKSLLSKGADVNARDERDQSVLHLAARYGHTDIARLLIAKGADINAERRRGWTPLHEAADRGHKDLARSLMAAGAEFSPIHMAAYFGDLQRIKSLIAEGVSVNARDKVGFAPVHCAVSGRQKEVVEFLISNGADANAEEKSGWTALVWAIWNHDADTVRLLLDKGADANVQDETGFTPLTWAIWEDNKDIVELLVGKGANINMEDTMGGKPLYWAAFTGGKEVFELLLAKGSYPMTIHLAACKGDLAKVKTFMEEGTEVNATDRFGFTPLHWAVLADTNEVAGFLIDKGADVNAKSNHGFTPLIGARRLDMIELLISKGADINAKIKQNGRTKLHMACLAGHKDMAEFLISKGADINVRTAGGATPLHLAASRGRIAIVELLLNNGAELNAKDRRGRTPLSMAKLRGQPETAELLRKHGAKE